MIDDRRRMLEGLDAMQIEPEGAPLRFADRLARENGWSGAFAAQVMTEYRRFLFLAATADHAVTPSDAVDQAWHLHLAYSRHYWDELCGRILGRPLHHGPTAGGDHEDRRYRDQYQATLDAYRTAFGAAPPPDIWPPVDERFRPARFERVDRSRHWLLPRRPAQAALLVPLVAGCALISTGSGEPGASFTISPFLFVALIIAAVFIAIRRSDPHGRRRRRRRNGSDDGCGSDSNGDSSNDSGSDGDSGCSSGCGGGGCGGD
ncbi:glycine-rich domain-containing protein [Sphingomonas sanxanigenens]|uniref:TIGR04222 domain-containing membrane protein n=1 Tax=Sphingomonas sanxanigenens DSM 19645 = NX02 TaxID=1123269 RepID=W0AJD2_9SPHN|nr:hypothetical protein [Sphingomonas sanxanigenens]AHE56657.1 hypothetical protein NX02_25250 [Sphingomonas sanxanigenens DSM 19645 = NX02]